MKIHLVTPFRGFAQVINQYRYQDKLAESNSTKPR